MAAPVILGPRVVIPHLLGSAWQALGTGIDSGPDVEIIGTAERPGRWPRR